MQKIKKIDRQHGQSQASPCPVLLIGGSANERQQAAIAMALENHSTRKATQSDLRVRSPHPTISVLGLCGELGSPPSEYDLADGGVLLLDDVREFPLQSLRRLAKRISAKPLHVMIVAGTADAALNQPLRRRLEALGI